MSLIDEPHLGALELGVLVRRLFRLETWMVENGTSTHCILMNISTTKHNSGFRENRVEGGREISTCLLHYYG